MNDRLEYLKKIVCMIALPLILGIILGTSLELCSSCNRQRPCSGRYWETGTASIHGETCTRDGR